jgi:hypothetical protein
MSALGLNCHATQLELRLLYPRKLPRRSLTGVSAKGQIVLQKSKVAGLRIFRENTKREAIADSYNLNRVTEVACEFNVRR